MTTPAKVFIALVLVLIFGAGYAGGGFMLGLICAGVVAACIFMAYNVISHYRRRSEDTRDED